MKPLKQSENRRKCPQEIRLISIPPLWYVSLARSRRVIVGSCRCRCRPVYRSREIVSHTHTLFLVASLLVGCWVSAGVSWCVVSFSFSLPLFLVGVECEPHHNRVAWLVVCLVPHTLAHISLTYTGRLQVFSGHVPPCGRQDCVQWPLRGGE